MTELDRIGVRSVASGSDFARPHLSLSVFSGGRPEELASSLAPLAGSLELRFSAVGVFPGPGAVLFVAPVVTPALLDVHRRATELVVSAGGEPWGHYRPGRWVPHATLAQRVDDLTGALRTVLEWSLPPPGRVAEALVVRVPSGQPVGRPTAFTSA
jgi:2'-5' RNA ligase